MPLGSLIIFLTIQNYDAIKAGNIVSATRYDQNAVVADLPNGPALSCNLGLGLTCADTTQGDLGGRLITSVVIDLEFG